jgi:hypothetical protein
MTCQKGKDVILSGWQASGITDAIALGLINLPSIDPFDDMDAMVESPSMDDGMLQSICKLTLDELSISYTRTDDDSSNNDDDSDWESNEHEERGAFDFLREFVDEVDD